MTKLPGLDFLKSLDRKLLVNLGVRYGAVLLFLTVAFIPSCGRFQYLKGQLKQKKSQLQNARLKLSAARKAQASRDNIVGEILVQEERFFTEEELAQMLSMVSELAKQNNLQMTASKPIKENEKAGAQLPPPKAPAPPPAAGSPQSGALLPPPRPPYSDQEFEVDLTGGYHALGKFLSDLRNNSKFIHVKRLSILGAAGPEAGHEIKLTLKVYLRPQGTP